MSLQINDPITTEEQLRAILPKGTGNSNKKDLDRVNDVAAAFIARSPYVIISSAGVDRRNDISPKGDAPGFVKVHDETTLVIPDRPGNHRLDTFENFLINPRIGLFFVIPGHTDTLHIAGTARIARDQNLREQFAVNGRLVIPPFLTGCSRRSHAAIFSFCAGVMPPMPMFGRSLL